MECLGFKDFDTALKVRNEYFKRYHSMAKGLTVAREEGVFTAPYHPNDFDDYIASKLNFKLLGGKKLKLIKDLQECKQQLQMVVFSNAPKKYVKKVLVELGLWDTIFRGDDDRIFAVNDVLPHCKPEKEAFQRIFDRIGVKKPSECVMIEDSMKNVRCAKELGLKTVLVVGAEKMKGRPQQLCPGGGAPDDGEQRYDAPVHDDPAVDVAIETIEELRSALPELWNDNQSSSAPPSPPRFIPSNRRKTKAG